MSTTDSDTFQVTKELPPIPMQKESTDERGNGFGTCVSCKKFKAVWSHICGLCGAAYE